jgi:hypothetical protein
MSDNDLERRDIYVSNLQSALDDGERGLQHVPGHIKRIIREDMWQERIVQATGELAEYDHFAEFVNDPPPKGLGADVDMLKRMCKKDDEALRLLREVVTDGDGNPSGANQHSDGDGGSVDNINRSSGTSKDYTLDRLAREDPELYEKVVADEMSANAAAIEAGFRTKTVSVPVHKGGEPQVARAAESLAKHFNGHLTDLINELQRHA